jgi:endonuclease YncB( thermonuclease family)
VKSVLRIRTYGWLAIVVLGVIPQALLASVIHGRVVGISDGDTIKVLDVAKQLHTVRLMGIDAPEKAQPFGQRSKQSLSELIFQKKVTVTWEKKDKYGRTVGKILTEAGDDICLEQINRGMAWHYKQYAQEQSLQDRGAYARAEDESRIQKMGLWQDPSPTPPWFWRQRHRPQPAVA